MGVPCPSQRVAIYFCHLPLLPILSVDLYSPPYLLFFLFLLLFPHYTAPFTPLTLLAFDVIYPFDLRLSVPFIFGYGQSFLSLFFFSSTMTWI
jgi:hypothetical protein